MSPTGADSGPATHGGTFAIAAVPLALLAAWLLVQWRSQPPPARGAAASIEAFSAERAALRLAEVLGQGPHPSGSGAHTAVLAAITAELEALGLEVEAREHLVQSDQRIAVVRNLLAVIPGAESQGAGEASQLVLLVAHTDSVMAGPGASDDGSGVGVLLETARALLAGPALPGDVALLFSDGEEDGLLGARAFVRQHPLAERVGLVLNFEARGTGGPSMLFQTSGPNRWLMTQAAGHLRHPWTSSVADLVYNSMPNDTDLTEFIERGVPGINFAFIDGLPRYHTPLDDLEHLDRRSLQHHGDNALALARAFGSRNLDAFEGEVPPGEPAGHAIFFDVLSLGVVVWPVSWGLPMALGVLALALAASARSLRGRLGVRSLPGSALRALVAVAVAVALGSAGPWLARAGTGLKFPALAHPWTLELATWSGVLLALTWIGGRRRSATATAPISPAGTTCALLLFWALCGLATAIWVPAVSYLFTVPAAVAGLGLVFLGGGAGSAPGGRKPGHFAGVEATTAFVAALLWLPIVYGLRLGFGFAVPALIALPLSAVAAWSLPSLMRAGRSPRLVATLAMLTLVGASAALASAPHTTRAPGWLNLQYQVSDEGVGHYTAESYAGAIPEELASRADFAAPSGSFPQSSTAPAPRWDAPRPTAEVLGRSPGDRGDLLHLRSPRGAARYHLYLPSGAQLLSVRVPGANTSDTPGTPGPLVPADPGARSWSFSGLGPEGLVVELAYGDEHRHFELADEASELPDFMAPLLQARPDHLVPRGRGDTSVLETRVEY